MLGIFLFSCILIYSVYSPWIVGNRPLRTDCYASFSHPIIYLNISHYNPSGPLSLSAHFFYERHPEFPRYDTRIQSVEYDFKRVDRYCESSVIFTTLGRDNFRKLDVVIDIYLYKYNYKMGFIKYTFYKGFKQGFYDLLDINQNIAVQVQVLDLRGKLLGTQLNSVTESKIYLRSILGKHRELCLTTENNNAVILKPHYGSIAPPGFIFSFEADIMHDGKLIGIRQYTAFECYNSQTYSDDLVIFIVDDKSFSINYRVYYLIYDDDTLQEKSMKIQFYGQKIDYVHNLINIPEILKKVFLIVLRTQNFGCEDKTRPFVYLSEYRFIYFASITKKFNISNNVEINQNFFLSPFDPCSDLKRSKRI